MSQLTEFRKHKDIFFKTDPQSPLTPDQRVEFTGLKYFPENPKLRVTAKVQAFTDQPLVSMMTSTGGVKEYYKYGQFSFEVDGQPATLQVYQDADRSYYFLPFVDATAPGETYGAGRYLEIEPEHDGTFVIDFNYAYNPYCAYNSNWNCPIPPADNRLKVRIDTGEKKYHQDH
jgi:uncharacterized protein (DUF1684 family)